MPVIGLTGNFGMGKSTVLRLFDKLGATTFNVDTFVHMILEKPEMIKKISKVLGEDILVRNADCLSIDKKRMADIVFSDVRKKKAVEKLIHPVVREKVRSAASDALRADRSVAVIFEVPLLFEAGYENYFDKIIVVYCTRDNALGRLLEKGFSREEALKRSRSQMPISDKKKKADFIINNNGSLEKTELKVREIYKTITAG